MIYRVVHSHYTDQKLKSGWYVEKSEDGKGAEIVSGRFETWLEAKAEVDRLTRPETKGSKL